MKRHASYATSRAQLAGPVGPPFNAPPAVRAPRGPRSSCPSLADRSGGATTAPPPSETTGRNRAFGRPATRRATVTHEVRGVVARQKGAPVSVETILVPDPGPGEALVKVQACGVCHTDLHYREGGINDDFPFLLGHEAAGRRRGGRRGRHRRRARRLRHPQLAGGLRPVPRLPAGPALVLLRHPQRHPEDDPGRRHRARPRRWASARSPRRPWSPPGSAPRSTRPPRPAAAGLLGCGVMAGLGAAINTGDVGRGDIGRGHRLRRRRRRRDRRRPAGRRDDDHRRRRRRPEAGVGRGVRRHPHRQLPRRPTRSRRSASSPAASAPTWCIEAVGPPRDLRAGLLRPRPGRHRGPGRRARPRT